LNKANRSALRAQTVVRRKRRSRSSRRRTISKTIARDCRKKDAWRKRRVTGADRPLTTRQAPISGAGKDLSPAPLPCPIPKQPVPRAVVNGLGRPITTPGKTRRRRVRDKDIRSADAQLKPVRLAARSFSFEESRADLTEPCTVLASGNRLSRHKRPLPTPGGIVSCENHDPASAPGAGPLHLFHGPIACRCARRVNEGVGTKGHRSARGFVAPAGGVEQKGRGRSANVHRCNSAKLHECIYARLHMRSLSIVARGSCTSAIMQACDSARVHKWVGAHMHFCT